MNIHSLFAVFLENGINFLQTLLHQLRHVTQFSGRERRRQRRADTAPVVSAKTKQRELVNRIWREERVRLGVVREFGQIDRLENFGVGDYQHRMVAVVSAVNMSKLLVVFLVYLAVRFVQQQFQAVAEDWQRSWAIDTARRPEAVGPFVVAGSAIRKP